METSWIDSVINESQEKEYSTFNKKKKYLILRTEINVWNGIHF
jgi:hypothetical protein